jgi:hypothetical protein
MKNNITKFLLLGMMIIIGLSACKKDKPTDQKQSEAVQKYLELKSKMGAFNASSGQMNNFMSVIEASQFKNMMSDSTVTDTIPCDTTGFWDYWTCATVTEYDNEDGTHTTVYDYGDGCDEFGSLTKGKITYIWKNEGNNYYSKVLYDHYYSFGMEMNGFSEYSFTSDGDTYFRYDSGMVSSDSTVYPGLIINWSGESTGKDDITIVYDSGETYKYTSDFSNQWDNSSYTVLVGDYTYTSEPDGYEYHYQVTEPLVYNYECTGTWVAVSGIESIHYKDPIETYDFTIDYGVGDCDNLATVTENGETYTIDFGELMVQYVGEDIIRNSGGKNKR